MIAAMASATMATFLAVLLGPKGVYAESPCARSAMAVMTKSMNTLNTSKLNTSKPLFLSVGGGGKAVGGGVLVEGGVE